MFSYPVNNFFTLTLALFVIVSINPYYVWGYEQLAFSLFFIFNIFVLLFVDNGLSKERIFFSFFLFLLIFFYKLLIGASYFGALAYAVSLSFIFSINDSLLIKTFEKIKLVFAIILIPSIVLWFLHHAISKDLFFLGSVVSDLIPNQIKVEAGHGYALYPFTVVLDYMLKDELYRMSGPFDEPGVVGTIAALLLVADKVKYKSIVNIVLFISGLLSFSLAFYAILFVYFIFMSFVNFKILILLLISVFLLVVAANISETVSKYTLDRIQISSEGVSGDNRAGDNLNQSFNDWIKSSGNEFMFGIDDYIPDGSSSIKELPVTAGFYGLLLFLMIFFYTLFFFRKSIILNWQLFVFISLFALSVYQRPDVVAPIYYMIFIIGIMSSNLRNTSRCVS